MRKKMKQRLIDANNSNLIYALFTYSRYTGIDEEPYEYATQELLRAPTVDAIPVEWLKQWEEKHKNDPCYCMFVSEEILADWEKENEIN